MYPNRSTPRKIGELKVIRVKSKSFRPISNHTAWTVRIHILTYFSGFGVCGVYYKKYFKMEKKSLKMVKRQKSELKKVYMPVNKKEDNVAAIMSSSQSSRYDPVVNSLEGMHAPELTLVRHLAATDDITRRKAIRKLRKWLNILAAKVPDSPGKGELVRIITLPHS